MTESQHEILRHTDYRCHGCWQDLRLLPHTSWRLVAMPIHARGGQGVGEHVLAVCESCAVPMAMSAQRMAPTQPVPVLQDLPLDQEDISLTAGTIGLVSGWFVAGPALAAVGLVAGAVVGWKASATWRERAATVR